LPLLLTFNVPAAANLTLLIATILSGFGVTSSRWTPSARDQVRAGRLAPIGSAGRRGDLRLRSNRAIYTALGHYNIATTQWLPFYALYLMRVLPARCAQRGAGRPLLRSGRSGRHDLRGAARLFTLVVLVVCWGRVRDRAGSSGRWP